MGTSYDRKALEKMWDNQKDNPDGKLDVLFVVGLNTSDRVEKLEKRKRFDTAVSGIGGIIGGVLAILGKAVIWRS